MGSRPARMCWGQRTLLRPMQMSVTVSRCTPFWLAIALRFDVMSILTYLLPYNMKKLKNGWVQGSAQEFLELSDADMAYIETKCALAACLREQRMKRRLTQTELAARLETSQSRVAKMESGDATVSIDLLLQALYRIGTKRRQLAALL